MQIYPFLQCLNTHIYVTIGLRDDPNRASSLSIQICVEGEERGGGIVLAPRFVACEPAKHKVIRRQSQRTEPDLERPHATWYMVLAMADEIAKQALLNRVKEQGEAVRRLKAAQADKTQVRTHPSFFPPSLPRKNLDAFRHRDRCHSPFSFSSCSASLCSIADSVIVSPSLSFAKYARNRFSSKSVSLFLSCVFLYSLSFHVVDSYFSFTFLYSILGLLILFALPKFRFLFSHKFYMHSK